MVTFGLMLATAPVVACDCDLGCITNVVSSPTMAQNGRIFVLSNDHRSPEFRDVESGLVDVDFERVVDELDMWGTFYDISRLAPGQPYEMSHAGCDLPPTTFQVSTRDDTDPPTWSGLGEVEYTCWPFQGRGCGGAEMIHLTLDDATDDSGAVLFEVELESPLESSTVFMTSAVGDLGITQCGANLDHDLTAGVTVRVRAVDLSGNGTPFLELTPKGKCRTEGCGCHAGPGGLPGVTAGFAGLMFLRRRSRRPSRSPP